SKPALVEENMPAEFTAEQRAGFLHLFLHEGVTAFPHDRATAETADHAVEYARTFHIEQHIGAGIARHHILRQHHQQPVRSDSLAGGSDNTKAVAVAVEGDTDIRALGAHRTHQRG